MQLSPPSELVRFGSQRATVKIKIVLFDNYYMFRSTFGDIFRQSHQIRLCY
jgi:hypothetical protein